LEETANDEKFCQQLASLADVCVNDAFGSAYRAHVSTEGITRFVKQNVAEFVMEKEREFLGTKIAEAKHPFVVILERAKLAIKSKLSIIFGKSGLQIDRRWYDRYFPRCEWQYDWK
jgi:phosphoglycerate kinase